MRALLLSGGLDSAALAHWLRPDVAVTVDYGQRAAAGEVAASAALSRELGLRHEVVHAKLPGLGAGALSGRLPSELGVTGEWWPYRNQLLVTLAAIRLVDEGLSEILIGVVGTDLYADSRKPFLDAMSMVLAVQEGGVRLTAPAAHLTSVQLLRTSGLPRDLLGLTTSCDVNPYPCGRCAGCTKRQEVLAELEADQVQARDHVESGTS